MNMPPPAFGSLQRNTSINKTGRYRYQEQTDQPTEKEGERMYKTPSASGSLQRNTSINKTGRYRYQEQTDVPTEKEGERMYKTPSVSGSLQRNTSINKTGRYRYQEQMDQPTEEGERMNMTPSASGSIQRNTSINKTGRYRYQEQTDKPTEKEGERMYKTPSASGSLERNTSINKPGRYRYQEQIYQPTEEEGERKNETAFASGSLQRITSINKTGLYRCQEQMDQPTKEEGERMNMTPSASGSLERNTSINKPGRYRYQEQMDQPTKEEGERMNETQSASGSLPKNTNINKTGRYRYQEHTDQPTENEGEIINKSFSYLGGDNLSSLQRNMSLKTTGSFLYQEQTNQPTGRNEKEDDLLSDDDWVFPKYENVLDITSPSIESSLAEKGVNEADENGVRESNGKREDETDNGAKKKSSRSSSLNFIPGAFSALRSSLRKTSISFKKSDNSKQVVRCERSKSDTGLQAKPSTNLKIRRTSCNDSEMSEDEDSTRPKHGFLSNFKRLSSFKIGDREGGSSLFKLLKSFHGPLYQRYEEERSINLADTPNTEEVVGESQVHGSKDEKIGILELGKLTRHGRTLWHNLPRVISSNVLERLSSKEIGAQEAKFEILTSEVAYFRSMAVLEMHFALSSILRDPTILSRTEYKCIFGFVTPVRQCSEAILSSVHECFEQDVLMSDLGSLLTQIAESPEMKIYIKYCRNQSLVLRILQSKLKDVKGKFLKAIRNLENDDCCDKLPLESFILLPMQRITRLPLLVENIIHKLPPDHQEVHQLKIALSLLKQVSRKCNGACSEVENFEQHYQQLNELVQSLVWPPGVKQLGLISANRVLQLVETLPSICYHVPNLTIILFNDILLVAKMSPTGHKLTVLDYCDRGKAAAVRAEMTNFSKSHLIKLTLFENHLGETVSWILDCRVADAVNEWLITLPLPEGYNVPNDDCENDSNYENVDDIKRLNNCCKSDTVCSKPSTANGAQPALNDQKLSTPDSISSLNIHDNNKDSTITDQHHLTKSFSKDRPIYQNLPLTDLPNDVTDSNNSGNAHLTPKGTRPRSNYFINLPNNSNTTFYLSNGDSITVSNNKCKDADSKKNITSKENNVKSTFFMDLPNNYMNRFNEDLANNGTQNHQDIDDSQESLTTASHEFIPTESGQLALQPGDNLVVYLKDDSGWYYGKKSDDGEIGWFPGSHTTDNSQDLV